MEHPHENESLDTAEAVKDHLEANMRCVRCGDIVNGQCCPQCVDGRQGDAEIIGTPGGAIGEVAVTEAALRRMGVNVTPAMTEALVDNYADTTGVYEHTDEHSLHAMHTHLKEHAVFRGRVPEDFTEFTAWFSRGGDRPADRPLLMTIAQDPRFVGCGHEKLILTQPEQYSVPVDVMRNTRAAFLRRLWDGDARMHWVPLKGAHGEQGAVVAETEGIVNDDAQLPAFKPNGADGQQLFIYHPQARKFAAEKMIPLILEDAGLPRGRANELFGHIQAVHTQQLNATLAALAPGLPIWKAKLKANGHLDVTSAGNVPGQRRPAAGH